jgi:predicted dehydrogenase
MAETVADCQAMLSACQTAGVRLMMAYRSHFDEASIDAVALARGGQLGVPRLFTSLLTRPQRKGSNRAAKLAACALWELATYPIHAARQLFEGEPQRVFAALARGEGQLAGVDATLGATLIFAEDRFAQFSVSLAASAVSQYRLIGERGDLLVQPACADDEPSMHVLTIGSNSIERHFAARRDPIAAQISALSRAIRDGGEVDPSGHEGLADVRVVEALAESHRARRSVDLERQVPLGRTAYG